MSDALAPAAAARMDKTATGAAADYLAARRELFAEEIELRRHTERVAEMRRALPPGPLLEEDYVPDGAGRRAVEDDQAAGAL